MQRSSLLVLALAVAAVVPAGSLAAQGSVSGVVRDSARAPIVGAEVTLEGIAKPVMTGRRGEFAFANVGTGPRMMNVRRVGYAPFRTIVEVRDGANPVPDVVLGVNSVELDTVAIRDQQILRENPLLREMEENRKVGLGQFVTRAQLETIKGGMITQVFDQMRGLVVIRSLGTGARTWLANKYFLKTGGCTELEEVGGDPISPHNANCDYCSPDIYLDYTKISTPNSTPNIRQFAPDGLQGIEVYLGAAETPQRYASGASSCGVVVFHTRVAESKPRVIARRSGDGPTRSKIFASAGISAPVKLSSCEDCGSGSATDVMLGYTLQDRFVIGGRHARWTATEGGPQSVTMDQAILEWYPHPEPARVKWFVHGGAGVASYSLNTTHGADYSDAITARRLPTMLGGTGVDFGIFRRLVLTPFFSYSRTIGGLRSKTRCVNAYTSAGVPIVQCLSVPDEPQQYRLREFGARLAWR